MKSLLLSCVLYLSLMLFLGEIQANENESCVATRIAEEQCGEHTYKAVRPLLKYIHQMKEEIENNNKKIEGKDKEIKQLQEKLAARNERLIEEQKAQIDFYKQTLQELTHNVASIKDDINKLNSNSLKMHDFEDQLEQQKKSIAQNDQNMSKIENEPNISAEKLKSCEGKPVYSDCTDFADAPGIHKVNPDRIDSFDVLCDSATAGPGWTVIQQRINGKEDFYRNWATYREGFGSFDGDFFLGLERIHRLTRAQPHELYIHMEGFDGVIEYIRYDQFAISGEEDQYTLITLGKSEGSATNDYLLPHKHKKFSTYDRDNDTWEFGNCASRSQRGGGWWYFYCAKSNLNGKYYNNTAFKPDAIAWGYYNALKTVKMLVRPKSNGK